MFPDKMTRTEVLEAIDHALSHVKRRTDDGAWVGASRRGFGIRFKRDALGRLKSAWPDLD